MKIGICDDSVNDIKMIKETCTECLKNECENIEIITFSSAEEFLESDKIIDILILDIEMDGMSGIELKNYLQRKEIKTMIIFVTDHDELVLSAFGMNVFGFAMKKMINDQLPVILKSAISVLNQYIMIDGIDSRNIIYIKAERIYSNCFLADGSNKLLRTSLNTMELKLESVGFIRIHRTYLVNARWIDKILEGEVLIKDKRLPVSARLQSSVKKEYKEYCEKNARYC